MFYCVATVYLTYTKCIDFGVCRRRPSALTQLLIGHRVVTEAAREELNYWFNVLVLFQRSLARGLLEDVQDALNRDPTGRQALHLGVDRLGRWSRRVSENDE